MRIALIHYRLLRNGGLETRLFNYLKEFRKLGHDVTLVVSKIDTEIEVHPSIKIEQVDLKLVPKPMRMYYFDKALAKIIQNENFDLSFSLGRTSNQDIVLCPGNHLGYLAAINKRYWSPIDWLNVYLDKKAYRKSKLILACSEMMKQELIKLFKVPADKIEVLLPPIDASRFNQLGMNRRSELRTKYGLSSNKKSLLFLTTGNERKGYPFLLELMNKLIDQPIELIVAGVKPMSTALPNVKYVGYTDKPEELLWAADGLIHPAKYEPFGQVITEAIECGTPVLISDMVGAKEIVSKDVGIVVNGFNADDWIKAIIAFTQTTFSITKGFSEANKLTVAPHCARILALAQHIKSS